MACRFTPAGPLGMHGDGSGRGGVLATRHVDRQPPAGNQEASTEAPAACATGSLKKCVSPFWIAVIVAGATAAERSTAMKRCVGRVHTVAWDGEHEGLSQAGGIPIPASILMPQLLR